MLLILIRIVQSKAIVMLESDNVFDKNSENIAVVVGIQNIRCYGAMFGSSKVFKKNILKKIIFFMFSLIM